MVNIDLTSGVPIDEQIVMKMSNLITAGAIKQNQKLSKTSELAKTLTTSINNVNLAYKKLEEIGLIYKIGEEFYAGNQNVINQEDITQQPTETINTIDLNIPIKSQSCDEVIKDLEDNISLLLENDFTEDYLIEIINKQESLLKIFEKNTALLLQKGVQKDKLVDLVKTINSRKL